MPSFDVLTTPLSLSRERHLHGQQAACMRVVSGSGSFSKTMEIGYFLHCQCCCYSGFTGPHTLPGPDLHTSVIIPTSAIPYPHTPTPPHPPSSWRS